MNSAIVELHDVSPFYRAEFLKAVELLEELQLDKYALLVVPYFWEKAPIGGDRDFLLLLKSLPAEVVLHGYTHRGSRRFRHILWTDGEGEFGGIDLLKTFDKVRSGKELLEYFGFDADLFVPPAWIGNPYLEDVLYSLGFRGVAYRWHLKDLTTGQLIKSPAITFSNRYILSWLSLKLVPELERLYSNRSPLRVAIHMADFRDERKVNFWKELLSRLKDTRRWTSYGEVFGESRPSSPLKGFQRAGRVVQQTGWLS